MPTFADIKKQMRLPVIGAPLFIVSNPKLVIAQCTAGIIGSFPALNARPQEALDDWLNEIKDAINRHNDANPDQPAAPYAVNQIVHRSNDRLMADMETCVKHEVPVVICSLGAREEVYEAVHSYGGLVLHD
ncbi:MAG: nitronate monooxygenase, partial [Pseudomonadota bacterium]